MGQRLRDRNIGSLEPEPFAAGGAGTRSKVLRRQPRAPAAAQTRSGFAGLRRGVPFLFQSQREEQSPQAAQARWSCMRLLFALRRCSFLAAFTGQLCFPDPDACARCVRLPKLLKCRAVRWRFREPPRNIRRARRNDGLIGSSRAGGKTGCAAAMGSKSSPLATKRAAQRRAQAVCHILRRNRRRSNDGFKFLHLAGVNTGARRARRLVQNPSTLAATQAPAAQPLAQGCGSGTGASATVACQARSVIAAVSAGRVGAVAASTGAANSPFELTGFGRNQAAAGRLPRLKPALRAQMPLHCLDGMAKRRVGLCQSHAVQHKSYRCYIQAMQAAGCVAHLGARRHAGFDNDNRAIGETRQILRLR